MRIYSYPYINNINNVNYQKNYVSKPSFGAKIPVKMQDKLSVLFTETKKLYLSPKTLELNDFEKIIKKISPETTVRNISEVPSGSNVSARTGAYFSQLTHIDTMTNEMVVDGKIIYLNLNIPNNEAKLKLFGDFIHEATHIAQEEAGDRLSSIDFCKKFLKQSISPFIKRDSVVAAPKVFAETEYNVLQPLIQMLRKNSDLPVAIAFVDDAILDVYYKQMSGFTPSDFVKAVTDFIIKNVKNGLPNIDDNYVISYAAKKSFYEKEAYEQSLKFLKDVMKIRSATDLDYRIILYDKMTKTLKKMAEHV